MRTAPNVIDFTAPTRNSGVRSEGTRPLSATTRGQGERLARKAPSPFPGSPFCATHERRLVDCLLELGAADVRAHCREA